MKALSQTHARTWKFLLAQPPVFWPAVVGVALLVSGISAFAGIICIAAGVLKGLRLTQRSDLDMRLELREGKTQRGIERRLSANERQEVLAIADYVERLRAAGVPESVATQTLDGAWDVVRAAGDADARARLRHYREGLPPIAQRRDIKRAPDVSRSIQRELDILRATEREIESVTAL